MKKKLIITNKPKKNLILTKKPKVNPRGKIV